MKTIALMCLLVASLNSVCVQGTVPVFKHVVGQGSYTMAGRDPAAGGTTTIPTVLVPITLSFDAKRVGGKNFAMDPTADVMRLITCSADVPSCCCSATHVSFGVSRLFPASLLGTRPGGSDARRDERDERDVRVWAASCPGMGLHVE